MVAAVETTNNVRFKPWFCQNQQTVPYSKEHSTLYHYMDSVLMAAFTLYWWIVKALCQTMKVKWLASEKRSRVPLHQTNIKHLFIYLFSGKEVGNCWIMKSLPLLAHEDSESLAAQLTYV